MQLNCPQCRFLIPADDVNVVKTIAKCRNCNNLFDFGEEVKGSDEISARYRKEIIMPKGVEVLRLLHELEIMIKWRQSAKTFTIGFALFWNAFIIPFTLLLIFAGGATGIPIFLFLMLFNLIGMYLLYVSIGYLVNTTYIAVDDKGINVDHRPLKFLTQKDKYYPVSDVEQIFVKRYSVGTANNESVYAYEVAIQLKGGNTFNIVKGLKSVDYARFIEQEIELYLKIRDRPVAGEWDMGL